jgi:hypothetical protein
MPAVGTRMYDELRSMGASSWWRALPGRFHSPQFRDQNRRDIGKSQSIWTGSKMETARLPLVLCGRYAALDALVPESHHLSHQRGGPVQWPRRVCLGGTWHHACAAGHPGPRVGLA